MDDLIYNQRDIPKDKWRYGFRSSAATGCGWIATYNALRLMGYNTDIEELIRYYQWQLPLLHGNTGTSFWGPAVCFRQWNFPVELCFKRDQFDATATRSDVCILFYHWRKDGRWADISWPYARPRRVMSVITPTAIPPARTPTAPVWKATSANKNGSDAFLSASEKRHNNSPSATADGLIL